MWHLALCSLALAIDIASMLLTKFQSSSLCVSPVSLQVEPGVVLLANDKLALVRAPCQSVYAVRNIVTP